MQTLFLIVYLFGVAFTYGFCKNGCAGDENDDSLSTAIFWPLIVVISVIWLIIVLVSYLPRKLGKLVAQKLDDWI